MTESDPENQPLDMCGQLEMMLIKQFLRANGYEFFELNQLSLEQKQMYLRAAVQFAALQMTEIETRSRFDDLNRHRV
ncbi:MAG: hypothetical protein VB013_06235 [Anaerolineaceae bacterium]|nr:hypothetical protein [Anaerolineaceae bacterium]